MLASSNTHSSLEESGTHSIQETKDPHSSLEESGPHSSLQTRDVHERLNERDDCSGGVQKGTRKDDRSGGVQKDAHIGDKKDTHIGDKIQMLSEKRQDFIDASPRERELPHTHSDDDENKISPERQKD